MATLSVLKFPTADGAQQMEGETGGGLFADTGELDQLLDQPRQGRREGRRAHAEKEYIT